MLINLVLDSETLITPNILQAKVNTEAYLYSGFTAEKCIGASS